jgi:hypothetical protein
LGEEINQIVPKNTLSCVNCFHYHHLENKEDPKTKEVVQVGECWARAPSIVVSRVDMIPKIETGVDMAKSQIMQREAGWVLLPRASSMFPKVTHLMYCGEYAGRASPWVDGVQ